MCGCRLSGSGNAKAGACGCGWFVSSCGGAWLCPPAGRAAAWWLRASSLLGFPFLLACWRAALGGSFASLLVGPVPCFLANLKHEPNKPPLCIRRVSIHHLCRYLAPNSGTATMRLCMAKAGKGDFYTLSNKFLAYALVFHNKNFD